MKPLTPKTRGAIVYGHNCDIQVAQLPNNWGVGKQQLMTYLNAFSFIKENNENRRLCSKKIATTWTAQTKQPISHNTIRRNLKKVGLTACVPRRKPAITEAHCQARLEWAYEHENWTERKWKRVLFSDESTFTQFQQGRQGMGNGIFQEDNAAPHRSRVATAARENAGIVTLDWPAQSPDINPIENIWAEMKMMI
ncbi:transposable element Tc1 transposase [Rhizophagus irregularis DAOM 181602=DAOM 197198]|nr:transposable element Tc1 transposase [Rhizophagus irregularis DAOM 181602=DAOM 197198]